MDDRRRRRWRALLPALLLGGVVALTVTWVVGGQGSGVSLLGGPFPLVLKLAALVCWITAVVRSGGRWWRSTVPRRVGVTVAVVGSIAFALHWSGTVDDHYPPSFAVWVGAAILALLVCPPPSGGVAGGDGRRRWPPSPSRRSRPSC